jgi:hypothetical protein
MSLLAEELCPVTEGLFGRLYRCSPQGVAALVKTVPLETRAMLALYCYRRAHLQSLGLAIAETCSEHDLWWVGGKMGMELSSRAKQPGSVRADARAMLKKPVTLASGHLWQPPPLED